MNFDRFLKKEMNLFFCKDDNWIFYVSFLHKNVYLTRDNKDFYPLHFENNLFIKEERTQYNTYK
jgi:hypothetical protein